MDCANAEAENFEKVFSKRELPDEMPEFEYDALIGDAQPTLVNIMAQTKLFPSKAEIKRLVEQGGVKMDSQKVSDAMAKISKPEKPIVIQAGKRIFFRLK